MYNEETELTYNTTPDEAAEAAAEAAVLRAEELAAKLNTSRVRVAMLLAGVRPDRLERAVRLAAPAVDENGEYEEEALADEVAAVLREFPELTAAAAGMPRMGAMDRNEQAIDPIAEIFNNK